MRGGTSRGPYFKAADLPSDLAARDRVLLAVMGSPDARQIDGIGGATTLTSKVAIVSHSDHPAADIDYLFAQVSIDQAFVDTAPSCGNMLSGVGPYAIENGMVEAQNGETLVRIRNVNTGSLIDAIIKTPGRQVAYEGTTAIDGVPGTAAPVVLNFREIVGTKTGSLMPTGNPKETIEGVEVSCVDVAMPMVIMAASSLGKTGYETKEELDADETLLARIESIRHKAGERMGLGDVTGKVVPKVALLAKPRHDGDISSRYFVPDACHAAHAVTGAICVAVTSAIKDSVADGLVRHQQNLPEKCVIEHPSGRIEVALNLDQNGETLEVNSAGVIRTTRKLFTGQVHVPAAIWDGR
jgi:2-methylaconitate cis-trans-isomerase PrpF